MDHNNYSAASWPPSTTNPGDLDAQRDAPPLLGQRPFQQPPGVYQFQNERIGNPSVSQVQHASNVPANSHPSTGSHFPSFVDASQHYPLYQNPYGVVHSQRPSPFWHPEQQSHASHEYYGLMPQSSQGYQSFHPAAPSNYNPHRPGLSNPVPPPHNRRRNDPRTNPGSFPPNVPADLGYSRPSLGARTQDVRPPHQAPSYPGESGQPLWSSLDGPGRRSDRSTSSRASNRRNFERYSVDLSQSSTSSDAEEAAARAPPLNRARERPREVRPRYAGRHPHVDPNIATAGQIQQLKRSLRRHLPSALPEDASKACDICSKDYATTHVAPTEEDECAVELACKHIFGEFCIGQWFDTCRSQKHKISCPMCRQVLIETPRRIQPMMPTIMHGQAFLDLLREQAGDSLITHEVTYEWATPRHPPL